MEAAPNPCSNLKDTLVHTACVSTHRLYVLVHTACHASCLSDRHSQVGDWYFVEILGKVSAGLARSNSSTTVMPTRKRVGHVSVSRANLSHRYFQRSRQERWICQEVCPCVEPIFLARYSSAWPVFHLWSSSVLVRSRLCLLKKIECLHLVFRSLSFLLSGS